MTAISHEGLRGVADYYNYYWGGSACHENADPLAVRRGAGERTAALHRNRNPLRYVAIRIRQPREKAGTIEGVHDAWKNELAGVMPSRCFGAHAAWLLLVAIAHNVTKALRRLARRSGCGF